MFVQHLSIPSLLGLFAAAFIGCGHDQPLIESEYVAEVAGPLSENRFTPQTLVAIPRLPWSGGTGATAPWGGGDPTKWRPEAILANSASEALNTAWALANVKDVIVAIPAKLLGSDFREFGDGQANSAPSFEWWHESRPPIVAALVRFTGAASKVRFRFDRALPTDGSGSYEIQYKVAGMTRTVSITATKSAAGDFTVEWTVPSELGWDNPINTQAVIIHPKGWRDWFPLWFRFPVRSTASLKATVPVSKQKFADGGDIVDHERMSAAANVGSTQSVQERLMARASSVMFSSAYNNWPFNPPSIHARFPWGGRTYVTGVGQGWTWVADKPYTPFKLMYTCFEKRRPDLEASASDGGVTSGGGWHRIGDPAETILNDLEPGPLAVASAQGNPVFPSALPSGGFSYNLTDVVTVRWLFPGEAFITPKGQWVPDGGSWFDQSNYHWYFFQQAQHVCTEEWVHPCVPNASLDYTCP